VGSVFGGAIILPATRDAFRRYLDFAYSAPDELTTIGELCLTPPAPFVPEDRVGEPGIFIMLAYAGDPEEGERVVAGLRDLAEPIAESVGAMPYPAMYAMTEMAAMPHVASVRSLFTDYIPDQALDDMIEAVGKGSALLNMVQVRPLGGAFARVDAGETAFAHRERKFMASVISVWGDPAEDGTPHRQWTTDLFAKLSGLNQGVYSNFLEREGDARVRDAYPAATYARLAEVKRRYDPENVFQFNQNIKPAE
jgi:hypothetical protein